MLFLKKEISSFNPNVVEDCDNQLLNGSVIGDEVEKADTLRRSILKMPHIDVEPPTVEQKATVAGRFAPISVVHIGHSELQLVKDIVPHEGSGPFRRA